MILVFIFCIARTMFSFSHAYVKYLYTPLKCYVGFTFVYGGGQELYDVLYNHVYTPKVHQSGSAVDMS